MPLFNWEFWKAALIRAVRTFAEGCLAYIGGDAIAVGKIVLADINFLAMISAGTVGFIVAILLSLAGLPEVKKTENN